MEKLVEIVEKHFELSELSENKGLIRLDYPQLPAAVRRRVKMNTIFTSIEKLIRQAGQILLQGKSTTDTVHQKEGLANFCTDFDLQIQRFLIAGLQNILPEASFFGEEDTEGSDTSRVSESYTFFVDPIDGTTNFIFDYHHSCISVGLSYRREIIAGFIYNPYVDEMFIGIRGEGCYLNGRKLQIADTPLSKGIVAFGCARYNEGDTDLLFDAVKEIYLRSLSVRNGGSAALDLCRIASGSNAAYLELKLQPYDYAAASVIIEEAGGVIGQTDGKAITLDRPCSILAGTETAVKEIRELLKQLQNS